MLRTHYDNLKVSRDAPIEVIRAAFNALSAKYYPDAISGSVKAAEIFGIINRSYEVLSDPVKRAEHDRWIAESEVPPVFAAPPFQQVEEHWLQAWMSRAGKWTRSNGYWASVAVILVLVVAGVALISGGKRSVHTEAPLTSPGPAPSPQIPQAVPAIQQLPPHEFQTVPASAPRFPPVVQLPQQMAVMVPRATARDLREPCRRPALAPDGRPWPVVSG